MRRLFRHALLPAVAMLLSGGMTLAQTTTPQTKKAAPPTKKGGGVAQKQTVRPPEVVIPTPEGDTIETFSMVRIPFMNVSVDKDGIQLLTKSSSIGTRQTMGVSEDVWRSMGMEKAGYRVCLDPKDGSEVRYAPKLLKFVRGVPVMESEGGQEFTVRMAQSGTYVFRAVVVNAAAVVQRPVTELVAEWKKNPTPETMYSILQYNTSVEAGSLVRQTKEAKVEEQAAKIDEMQWLLHPATDALLRRIANDAGNPNSAKAKALIEAR